MYKKTKFSWDSVVRHNTLRILFILLSLFTLLMADVVGQSTDDLPPPLSEETNATAMAENYNSIGLEWYDKSDYNKALSFFEKALKIQIVTIGENHPSTATSYNGIGLVWSGRGRYNKAIDFYNKSLKIQIATLGENHPDTADNYSNLGGAWANKGEYNKALDFFNKSLNIRLTIFGKNHSSTATSYNNIGYMWNAKNDFNKAIEFFNKSLKIELKLLKEGDSLSATNYTNIGSAWKSKGEYEKAMEFYEKALEITIVTLGENHPSTATSYSNIGEIWRIKDEYEKAIEFYNKALNIRVTKLGENHHFTMTTRQGLAYIFNAIGSSYIKKKQYDKAIDYYSRALILHKKIAQIDPKRYSDEVLTDIDNIINTHRDNNQLGRAKDIYLKALEYYKKLFKKNKQAYGLDYARVIIDGVESFDLDKDRLDKAKKIIFSFPKNSQTKGLLLRIEELEGSKIVYILIFLILFLIGAIFYFRRYKNPLVLKLSENSSELMNLNVEQLKETQERLTKINKFKNILSENSITTERYENAIAFENLNQEEKANYFTKRIFAKAKPLTKQSYMLELNDDFPLNVKQFILFMSDKESIDDMMSEIKEIPQYRTHIIFVLSECSELQEKIYHHRDRYEKFVIVHPREITQILLGVDGAKTLAESFSQQLALTQISPYQLGGGVKSSMFFGRAEIVSHILGRENSNYIVVGSRQIGKSSLLKAIEREYVKNREQVHYISVGKSDFVRAMARALDIKVKSLEELVAYLASREEKSIFLLDEVDPFIREENENGYKILDSFRKLSEEGRCNFILAGYWELYFYTMFDNQSPLKNFGEAIELGALEAEACYEMITEPMEQLGLKFESEEAIEEIIERTGKRPNLIAIICNNIIKNVGKEKRVITLENVKEAIKGKKVYELFESWKKLDEDKRASRLDKIIVYSMVEKGSFRLKALVERLKELGLKVEMSELENSLARLKVSYTIQRDEEGMYGFSLPLFREYILGDDYEVKLEGEISMYG